MHALFIIGVCTRMSKKRESVSSIDLGATFRVICFTLAFALVCFWAVHWMCVFISIFMQENDC